MNKSLIVSSRLINHSCDPSASAKIISINGQSKVCSSPQPTRIFCYIPSSCTYVLTCSSFHYRLHSDPAHAQIVIYAKKTLEPGDEILYDYKFPLESDPALRVPCLCGAATCRGWLN